MIEPNNPDIDVDALMARVRTEVAKRRLGAAPAAANGAGATPAGLDVGPLEDHVSSAARVAEVRTAWPPRLRFFPFTIPAVQRLFLAFLAFLFSDQRNVNAEIVHALHECVALNRLMAARIAELEERLRRLESRG